MDPPPTESGYPNILIADTIRPVSLSPLAFTMRIPMMPISQSDLMPISSEASNAGLPQCELVIGIRQDFSRVGLFD